MSKLHVNVELTPMTCSSCGVSYAVNKRWAQERSKKDANGHAPGWVCPNGCPRIYRTTDEERLRQKLENKERELERTRAARDRAQDRARHNERRLIAQKGVTTRIKNRIAKGVCPCCRRSFQNLMQHMHTKHPGYAQSEG